MTVRRLIGAASAVGALTAASLLGITGLASAQEDDGGKKEWFTLSASGSGDEEVPEGSGEEGTDLTASISLTEDGDMTYTITVSGNSETISAAHIHKGKEGENGDVVVELDAEAVDEGKAAEVELEPDLAKRIIENPENWYINTHSESFQPPSGVARAQLKSAEKEEKPDIIDTGDGGQFAASQAGPNSGAVAAGALLIASAAGGAIAFRRRSGTDNA
ncbi:CHRD domain-containing protein [Pseudonocardia humida]|uniref:CHRD domain-containing protein n=1 Tax=Pseudonocardia humida TaxID=2800819 RepID=A0ABT1A7F3_9PSEU|nr:CHRD domain-containing protein [Pseudonocardia humida]MCO1658943.1 CHRD domain-containing protein [Pseudonocardia humida]